MKKPNQNLYVVGIGASAGGLKAIQKLFDHIPEDTGMAFVIIQHLSPDYKSLMQELLSKHTQMKVLPAENELTIEPNCIYLNQRNKNLTIEGKRLRLIDRDRQNDLHLPIDMFFHSLGQEFKEKSIGIILSGTGSDGSRGIRTIKEAGGTIIAEDPTSAQFDGMPNSSIATNLVDYILPPNKIPEVILRLSNQRVQLTSSQQFASTDDVNFYRILNEIHKSSGIDFRKYKRNTLLRRLEKRMTMNNIDQLYDYLTFLQNMPSEKQTLQQDFLIGVTSFFRDREAFNSLKETLPIIFNGKNPSDVVRIWVAGCSTGEEVYSIAILVDEYIHKNKLLIDFKIFATDIDQKALDLASVGQYHINSISELEEKHLEKYFTVHENGIQIKNRIREKIVFSKHNLLKDPPFIRMDMITCRNLLIYLETNIQSKVLMSFQFALKKSGVLFLGNSESLGKMSKYFHPLDPKWNIFKNISDTKLINFETNPESRVRTLTYNSPITQSNKPNYRIQEKPENIFYKFLSDVYSPDCIIFDKDYNVLFISGNAGQRIAVQAGIFQNNLLKMVEKEIASIIRSGIRRVTTESKQVVITDVINSKGNQTYSFDLTFRRIDDNAALQDLYLMEFSQERKTNQEIVEIPNIPLDEISKQRINDLENELREKKIELQNLIEELETSNEELQSSNEELMASNEELQSTNEELQSVNEELYTVNSELQEKNRELQFLNNDFTNLLNSTDIGTLFLDTKLRIRKSTPALNRHFNLQEEDIGRPISSFAANFTEAIRISIINHTREALEKLISVEKEILDNDGNYYLVKINPFITSDNHIDGVVISFINIHQLKAVENKLAASEIKYRQLFEKLNEGFMHARIITNEEGKPVDWEYITINPAFEHQTGLKMKEVVGKRKLDINPEVKDEPIDWIELYGETALTGKEQFIQSYSAPEDKYYYVHVFCPEQGEFAATFSDITEHKMAEEELRKTDIMYRGVIENAPDGIIMISYEGKFKFASTSALRMFGYTQDNLYNKDPNALTHPDDLPMVLDVLEKITKNENHKPQTLEYRFKNRKGDWHWIESTFSRSNNENGNPAIVINFRDIQKRKEHEKQLIAAKKQAELANLHKNNFLANMSHEIRTPMNGVIGFSRLLRRDNLSEAEREQYLDIIDVNAKQLLNLIDDIIDVAKIEASELNIETRSCNLQQLLNDTKTMFEQLGQSLEKDHINIFLKIPEENVVPHIETDPARLQQVINNLLHNALKFTEEGKIEFGYRVKENELEFYVSDTGIGIPQDQKEHIFEQFQQVDSSHQSKYDGTGLGLAICKGLIDLLGGKIWVESELGQGATFRFTIPHHPVSIDKVSENTTEKNELSIDSNGTTILIVDDNDMVHHFYKALLKPYGTKIIDATTAEKAIELFSANPEIDMVLMDIRMPKMSGPEALAAILKINPDARVIAQTAYAYEADKSKYLEMGFVDYLTKPIDEDILIAAITKHRCSNR